VAKITQAVCGLAKTEKPFRLPHKQEWEPLEAFRSVSTKVRKVDFDPVPANKKQELTRAIQRVQELIVEIKGVSQGLISMSLGAVIISR